MPFTADALADVPVFDPEQRISFSGHPVDYVQGFCCTCLPAFACITVECVATGEHTRAYIPIECGRETRTSALGDVYIGNIYLAGRAHMAYFTLDVSEDLKCFFCLEIPTLGFAKQCVQITDAHQVAPLLWCKSFTYEIGPYGERIPTTFVGDSYLCGQVIIRINKADVTPINGRPKRWIDEAGEILIDENSISGRCNGCGCISQSACVTLYHIATGKSESYAMRLGCDNCHQPCSTGHVYSTILGDYGPLISIEKDPLCLPGDPDCGCVLKLLQLSNMQKLTDTYSGLITKGINPGDCPFPSATWEVQESVLSTTLVSFRTQACSDEPCSLTISGCCVGVDMPTVIHCTIERTGDFVSESCECLPKTIPMLFDGSPILPAWTGRLDNVPGNGSWCNNSPEGNDFKVRMFCNGTNWTFQYGASDVMLASPCAGEITSPYDFVCRPVYFRFEANGACCGPSGIPGPGGIGIVPTPPQKLIFTITE
jgi:hypothetical protein